MTNLSKKLGDVTFSSNMLVSCMHDYLVVGSGLYGAIFAHEAKKHGKSVLVVEKEQTLQEMFIQKMLKV